MYTIKKTNLSSIYVQIFFIYFFSFFNFPSLANEKLENWKNILQEGSGQKIYFHAWGGAKNINSYINWAANVVKKKYNITVKHVKVTDTSNVVGRILAEKKSNKNTNGAVDIVWINGENFSFMKKNMPRCRKLEKNNN